MHRLLSYLVFSIQIFPGNLLSSTFVNPDGPNDIQARSELERRRNYIEILEALTSQHRTLVQLVKQCLHNVPDQRPSTEQLLTRLQGMRVEVEGEYGGGALKVDLMKAKLTKEVKVKHRRIEEQKVIVVFCFFCGNINRFMSIPMHCRKG